MAGKPPDNIRYVRDLPAKRGERLGGESLDFLEAELGPRRIEYESEVVVGADAQSQHRS